MRHAMSILAGLVLLLGGCVTDQSVPMDAPNRDMMAGYSLLYGVVSDEAGVSDLFLLRKPSEQTKALVEAIAKAAQGAKKQLEAIAQSDASLRLNAPGLPAVETDARGSIATDTAKRLLLGNDFDRTLLLSQIDATRYMAALADALAQREQNHDRAAKLKTIAKQMSDLHEQVVGRIKAQSEK